MKSESIIMDIAVKSVLAILIVLVLIAGKSFLIPFAWSLLIALASVNFIDRVGKKTKMSRS
jgi:predicted PurR-regulated permease PerM